MPNLLVDCHKVVYLVHRSVEMHEMDGSGFWKEVWQYKMALPVVHLKFSSDGTMFASAAEVG